MGCGPTHAPSPSRRASEPPADAAPPPREPTAARHWARFDEVSAWPAVSSPFPSRGHESARYTVEIRVNPESQDAYRALLPGTTLPSGTLIAAFHHDARRGRPGPIYVMEKVGTSWQFSIVAADGNIERAGELELCRRCHAEAVSDSVFGLPQRQR